MESQQNTKNSGTIEELAAIKLEEEVRLARAERRSTNARLIIEVSKAIILLVGAVIVFFAVQRPDSILSRKETEATIRRERAELLLEWLKEEDLSKRRQALIIIKAAYLGNTDDLLGVAEYALLQGLEDESTLERYGGSDAIRTLVEQKQALLQSLRIKLEAEVTGVGGTGIAGSGPVARMIMERVAEVNREIEILKSALDGKE